MRHERPAMPSASQAARASVEDDAVVVAAGYKRHPFPESFFRLYDFTLPWIEERIPPGSRVLDVGCGPGLLARDLLRRCCIRELIAFDIDVGAIEAAIRNLRGFHQVSVRRLDAEALDLPNCVGKFDVVLARNSFHHFERKTDFLRAVRDQILVPGGSLLLLDLDARANFALFGLGAYCTLLRAMATLGLRVVLEIVIGTGALQADAVRMHREVDRQRLIRQGWYTYRQVGRHIGEILLSASDQTRGVSGTAWMLRRLLHRAQSSRLRRVVRLMMAAEASSAVGIAVANLYFSSKDTTPSGRGSMTHGQRSLAD